MSSTLRSGAFWRGAAFGGLAAVLITAIAQGGSEVNALARTAAGSAAALSPVARAAVRSREGFEDVAAVLGVSSDAAAACATSPLLAGWWDVHDFAAAVGAAARYRAMREHWVNATFSLEFGASWFDAVAPPRVRVGRAGGRGAGVR